MSTILFNEVELKEDSSSVALEENAFDLDQETLELANDIDTYTSDISTAFEAIDSLESIKELGEQVKEDTSTSAVAAIQLSVETIATTLGIPTRYTGLSFEDIESDPKAHLETTMEGASDMARKAYGAVKAAIQKVIQFIKDLIGKMMNNASGRIKAFEKMLDKVKNLSSDTPDEKEVDNKSIAKAFGALITELSSSKKVTSDWLMAAHHAGTGCIDMLNAIVDGSDAINEYKSGATSDDMANIIKSVEKAYDLANKKALEYKVGNEAKKVVKGKIVGLTPTKVYLVKESTTGTSTNAPQVTVITPTTKKEIDTVVVLKPTEMEQGCKNSIGALELFDKDVKKDISKLQKTAIGLEKKATEKDSNTLMKASKIINGVSKAASANMVGSLQFTDAVGKYIKLSLSQYKD